MGGKEVPEGAPGPVMEWNVESWSSHSWLRYQVLLNESARELCTPRGYATWGMMLWQRHQYQMQMTSVQSNWDLVPPCLFMYSKVVCCLRGSEHANHRKGSAMHGRPDADRMQLHCVDVHAHFSVSPPPLHGAVYQVCAPPHQGGVCGEGGHGDGGGEQGVSEHTGMISPPGK